MTTVEIGTKDGFDYDETDNWAQLDNPDVWRVCVEMDDYRFFVGPDGYLWHMPKKRQDREYSPNVELWTKAYLERYSDNTDEWKEAVRTANLRGKAALQAKLDALGI